MSFKVGLAVDKVVNPSLPFCTSKVLVAYIV